MTTASFNYTGRKRINRKQFQVTREILGGDSNLVELNIWVDQKLLESVEEGNSVVLDVMTRGHERFELQSVESQSVSPDYLDRETAARYRLSIIDSGGEDVGKIRKSSDELKLVPVLDDNENKKRVSPVTQVQEREEKFFNPEESDNIGSQLWKVEFNDCADFQVLINSRVIELYDGDKHNPVLRAHILPPIVREIFGGLFMRNPDLDALQDTDAENWFRWAQYVTKESCPDAGFKSDEAVSDEWLTWLDELVETFAAARFVNGKHTLLEAMEEHGNA